MRHGAPLLPGVLFVALALLACEGEVEIRDARPADSPIAIPDLPPADRGSGDGAARDSVTDAPRIDTRARDGSLGACDPWSAWTCTTPSPYVCKATCGKHTLSCVSSGHCVCGVARAPCGPFTYAQPCDACKQAVSCCSP